MSFTKWLCKTFDKDKKGYITIGDVSHFINDIIKKLCKYVLNIVMCIIVGIAVILFILIMKIGAESIINYNETFYISNNPNYIEFFSAIFFISVIITSIATILIYIDSTVVKICSKISNIKIVQCKLKQKM